MMRRPPRNATRLALAALAALSAGAPALADVIYVNALATGANNGSSWADAFTNFNAALGAAQPGDEIWAAPPDGMATYFSPNALGFIAPAGVSLYGGFVGNETATNQRLPTNRTHLTGYNPTIGPIVLTLNNPTPGIVVDGFRFDGTLTHDHDGGGMAVHGGTVVVHNCLFIDNIAGSGAGAYLSNVHATFTDCKFDNNFCQVGAGGGIEAVGTGSLTVNNCHFHDNLSRELNGVAGHGGGIFADAGIGLDVRNSLFDFNRAYNLGQTNVAHGGGIANFSPNAHIENCSFIRNDASLGGAIYSEAPITIVNCAMAGNRAIDPPGNPPFLAGHGGAVYGPEGINLTVKNCTIASNWAKHKAGGLAMDGVVENSIIHHNAADVKPGDEDEQFEGDEIEIRYSTVQDLSTPDPDHPGTIAADPQFIQAPVLSNPEFNIPPYTPGDLHLQSGGAGGAGSPCIDAGDNGAVPAGLLIDLDAQPRFIDDPTTPDTGLGAAPIVDMGAYEFQLKVVPCSPDITGDGSVAVGDLLAVINAWGACAPACPADVTGDNTVDVQDLLAVINGWGPCP